MGHTLGINSSGSTVLLWFPWTFDKSANWVDWQLACVSERCPFWPVSLPFLNKYEGIYCMLGYLRDASNRKQNGRLVTYSPAICSSRVSARGVPDRSSTIVLPIDASLVRVHLRVSSLIGISCPLVSASTRSSTQYVTSSVTLECSTPLETPLSLSHLLPFPPLHYSLTFTHHPECNILL